MRHNFLHPLYLSSDKKFRNPPARNVHVVTIVKMRHGLVAVLAAGGGGGGGGGGGVEVHVSFPIDASRILKSILFYCR